MAKITVSPKYAEALKTFVTALETQLEVSVAIESGRKFDKVLVENERGDYVVRYFVVRTTMVLKGVPLEEGAIYGPKQQTTPNYRWFYGDIFSHETWIWTGKYPEPTTDADVVLTGEHGDIKYWVRTKDVPESVLATA